MFVQRKILIERVATQTVKQFFIDIITKTIAGLKENGAMVLKAFEEVNKVDSL
jgi:hypothetical protein